MSNLAIYSFVKELEDLLEAKDEAQDETELTAIYGELERVALDIATKVDGYATFLSRADSEDERLGREIAFLQGNQKRIKARAAWVRGRLFEFMKAQGVPELRGENHRFKIRQNPPAVLITDESSLPSKYVTWDMVLNINKRAIAEALKTAEVPGAELTRGERLECK